MDLKDPIRFRQRKSTSTERFLGVFSHAPSDISSSSSSVNGGDELNEADVVFLTGEYIEPNHPSTPSSPSTSSPLRHHHSHKGLGPPDTFGILAALPENEKSSSVRSFSHFYQKASVSSSSSSSSSSWRLIPVIPKPPPERISLRSSSLTVKYNQSAPVNVPVLSQAMMNMRRRHREFDEDDDAVDEGDGEMLPPHEIVVRSSVHSPMLACSVLEGVGRTLKGRDLRKVRNAVWRQTDFAFIAVSGCLLLKSMALPQFITALLFALAFARINLSTCQVVKGKLSCLDCTHNYDFSGIMVSVKCDQVKKLAVAIAEDDGSYEAELPSALNCHATVLGGPTQIYVSRKNMVSTIVKGSESTSYTTSTPLSFFTSCPQTSKCEAGKKFGSSKTVDLPLPPEWGLAPSSYYINPFVPIIGIP